MFEWRVGQIQKINSGKEKVRGDFMQNKPNEKRSNKLL